VRFVSVKNLRQIRKTVIYCVRNIPNFLKIPIGKTVFSAHLRGGKGGYSCCINGAVSKLVADSNAVYLPCGFYVEKRIDDGTI
jgi:ribosomal protein L2